MIAELKEIHSLELECTLAEYVPEQYDYFELTINAQIGPVGQPSSDSFEIRVCTPKWLQARCDAGEIISGRHTLIVGEFNFPQIRDYLSALCRRCSGKDWTETAQKLSRYALWEFEDYQPAR